MPETVTKKEEKIASSVEDENFNISKSPEMSKDQLFNEFYGAYNTRTAEEVISPVSRRRNTKK